MFKKQNSKWHIIQSFEFLKDGILSCDPEITDFNNDGFNDLTFQSSIAGRGANTIRKLFIFERNSGKLKFIKNSENFPNIRYNKELNCIDAFRVYGGAQTAFAKIENDTLREFANIEIYNDTLKVKIIDKNGKEKRWIQLTNATSCRLFKFLLKNFIWTFKTKSFSGSVI